jgi:hypothetical protein
VAPFCSSGRRGSGLSVRRLFPCSNPRASAALARRCAALAVVTGAIVVAAVGGGTPARAALEEVFTDGHVRVRVFCDDDGDGRADAEERGAWGARVHLDTGVWADADPGGKLHFSAVGPGMHLARLDERTLSGMSTDAPRRVFYLSPGLPADLTFPVRCATIDVGVDPADPTAVTVAADAWRPAGELRTRTISLRGATALDAPARLLVDGAPVPLPWAALDVATLDGTVASPTLRIPQADAGMQLLPRAGHAGVVAVAGWHIVIDDIGDAGTPRPVWVFAGSGALPSSIAWDGRSDTDAVLRRGGRYRATLTVAFVDGDRVTAAPRAIVVRGRDDAATLSAPFSSGEPTLQVGPRRVPFLDEGVVDTAVSVPLHGVVPVTWSRRDGSGVRVLVASGASSSSERSSVALASSSTPIELQVDPGRRTLLVDGTDSSALLLLGVRVQDALAADAAIVDIPRGLPVRQTTVQAFLADASAPWRQVVVDGAARRVSLGELPPAGTPLRLRAIVVDPQGNVGTSPDVVIGADVDPDGPVGPAFVLADPFGRGRRMRLKTEAITALGAFAQMVPRTATVRIEMHTDGRESRITQLAIAQAQAEVIQRALVEAGLPADRIAAIGRGAELPIVPNFGPRARRENRRAELFIENPLGPRDETTATVEAQGVGLAREGNVFAGTVVPASDGTITIVARDAAGAQARVVVPRPAPPPWQGSPEAYRALVAGVVAAGPQTPASTPVAASSAAAAASSSPDTSSSSDASLPGRWPPVTAVPAARLQVTVPRVDGPLRHDVLPLRGRADVASSVTVNGIAVDVDPVTGAFAVPVKLPEGRSTLVVEAVDALGDRARVTHDLAVDTTGWFFLALSDVALGADDAWLPERSRTTSLTVGDAFAYGRAAAWLKGRFRGPVLFSDYDLSLHLDTRRIGDGAFFRDVLDPERVLPAWGDSSYEQLEARSPLPLYLELRADDSRLSVGQVRTDVEAGDLLRYHRARPGARLVFDRGWLDPVDVTTRAPLQPRPDPARDPWRTRAQGFVADGGGARHARVELQGTGGSVYFLRHGRIVEGSERVTVIVRDAITAAEIAQTVLARNIDYTVRYDVGRVILKSPLSTFAPADLLANHNLGQVAAAHRTSVVVDYEHDDLDRTTGTAGGLDVAQILGGHAEVGSTYVIEGRADGSPAYQAGGVRAKLFLDEHTFLKAELLASQSVDAANFASLDGGLSWTTLGAPLAGDLGPGSVAIAPTAPRQGLAFKVDGVARLGALVGRAADEGVLRAYLQAQEAGFFGGGGSIVEQGQTKWGAETAWRLSTRDELRLRYDGLETALPATPSSSNGRRLHRQVATGRYARQLLPALLLTSELGGGLTIDDGAGAVPVPGVERAFSSLVAAAGLAWTPWSVLVLSARQEITGFGDPRLLVTPADRLVTRAGARWQWTDDVAFDVDGALRWSGEHQVQAGVGLDIDDDDRVYVRQRMATLALPGMAASTGRVVPSQTTVLGAERAFAPGSRAYGEYQLQSAFGAEQARGVVGVDARWQLPFGVALSLGYERIAILPGAGVVPTPPQSATETTDSSAGSSALLPGALSDGTFAALPGANGGGDFLWGAATRDAASASLQWRRADRVLASQRVELRFDDFATERRGRDVWSAVTMTALACKLSAEWSLLGRYHLFWAHDVQSGVRVASFEEGSIGFAGRPVTHDWFSAVAKVGRRVDARPSALAPPTDVVAVHAATIEPVLNLPAPVQLVEKVALRHTGSVVDPLSSTSALTLLSIHRANLHTLGLLRATGVPIALPGELDLGVEYRVLAGLTYAGVEHGALVEAQVVPVDAMRVGVGFNFTRFSDDPLEAGRAGAPVVDRSGFFIRVLGAW